MFCKKLIFILLVSVFFLNGCAYFQRPEPTLSYIPWKKRQLAHSKITSWDMSGVLSITRGKKRDIARFSWDQKPDIYSIKLSGPMSIGAVRIEGDEDGVRFWRTSDKLVEAETPEELLLQETGYELPVSDMRYWILGMPGPGKVDYKYFDRYGHLEFFKQKGWQVKYSNFQVGVKKDVDLPSIIEIKRKDLFIKIRVKKIDIGWF